MFLLSSKSLILCSILFFSLYSSSLAAEYDGSSIRELEEDPVDIQLNGGDPLRIREVYVPSEPLEMTEDEREVFEDSYGRIPEWSKSSYPSRKETLFSGNPELDQSEAAGAVKPWREERLDLLTDYASEATTESLRVSAFWNEGGAPGWEKAMLSEAGIRKFAEHPQGNIPWNAGVWNWQNPVGIQSSYESTDLPTEISTA